MMKEFRTIVIPLLLICLLTISVGSALADGPTVQPGYDDTAELKGAVRLKSFDNSNDREIYVGNGDLSSKTEVDFYRGAICDDTAGLYGAWQPKNHVKVEYSPTTGILKVTVNANYTYCPEYNLGDVGDLNYLQIDVVNRGNDTTVDFEEVKLNDKNLGNFKSEGWETWQVTGLDFTGGFTLEGDLVLDGTQPRGEKSKLQLTVGYVEPPPEPPKPSFGSCYNVTDGTFNLTVVNKGGAGYIGYDVAGEQGIQDLGYFEHGETKVIERIALVNDNPDTLRKFVKVEEGDEWQQKGGTHTFNPDGHIQHGFICPELPKASFGSCYNVTDGTFNLTVVNKGGAGYIGYDVAGEQGIQNLGYFEHGETKVIERITLVNDNPDTLRKFVKIEEGDEWQQKGGTHTFNPDGHIQHGFICPELPKASFGSCYNVTDGTFNLTVVNKGGAGYIGYDVYGEQGIQDLGYFEHGETKVIERIALVNDNPDTLRKFVKIEEGDEWQQKGGTHTFNPDGHIQHGFICPELPKASFGSCYVPPTKTEPGTFTLTVVNNGGAGYIGYDVYGEQGKQNLGYFEAGETRDFEGIPLLNDNPDTLRKFVKIQESDAWQQKGGTHTFDPANATICDEKPSAIDLAAYDLTVDNGQVIITWETATELDNAGFNIYRATSPAGPFVKINAEFILAQGDAVTGGSYTFVDRPGRGNFYYQLEDMDLFGVTTRHDLFQAEMGPAIRTPLFRPSIPE